MITKKQIRTDLKSIRYYYANKEYFEKMGKSMDTSDVLDVVKKYTSALKGADPKLMALFHGLYVEGHTQLQLSIEWCFSQEYISIMSVQLNQYLFEVLNKKEA